MAKQHPTTFTQTKFNAHFRRDWALTISYYDNARHYDPHGTKKPSAYADLVRAYVESGDLPEKALDWTIPKSFGGEFGRTCRKRNR